MKKVPPHLSHSESSTLRAIFMATQRSSGRGACLISLNWASCCDCFDFLKATAIGGRKAR